MTKKILKTNRQAILNSIRQCRDEGLTIPQTAIKIGLSRASTASISHRWGITGWRMGAAARDQTGSNNPNFKNGVSKGTINRLTKKTLLEAGYNLFKCERCGTERDIELPRHHINRNRSDNSVENLTVICVSCHNREHISERHRDSSGKFYAV